MDRMELALLGIAVLLVAIVVAFFSLGFSRELTKELCQDSDGVWNECGSACAGEPPGTVCTKECVPTCECYYNFQCPPGYYCKAWKAGENGACRPV
ncbi:MAG TPA: hypothetical protein VJ485_00080 [archaeon]|jgi:hypothetical protein|nr:hypothetical protein [archaeon]